MSIVRSVLVRARVRRIVRQVKRRSLTYLDERALSDLFREIKRIDTTDVPGLVIEAGCALGGSAIVLASSKKRTRPLHVYDVFGMIPPPTSHDGPDVHARYQSIRRGESEGIGGHPYYGYQKELVATVKRNFDDFGLNLRNENIHLIQGLFEDTLFPDEDVALAHIDADWYQSVMTCLERIEPHVAEGGVIIVDDYFTWSGCKAAVDEYFESKKDAYTFEKRARLHIRRSAPLSTEEPS